MSAYTTSAPVHGWLRGRAGGMVIAPDRGLQWIPCVSALMPLASVVNALMAMRNDKVRPVASTACTYG
ncbi:hypothetical protein W822_00220 [Advenella kashmirensis W13003]|uniref:Uncharacterized protein n=1 Tax=Advenella kashmirensis W13003 TaxID=1424334 RepID=V8QYB4_9BURK|nr:hypothetical protein [Advenella kashmirensis]ETF04617.1 hypothetical protein W822_00220 [Advenella kashmirensis W13003]